MWENPGARRGRAGLGLSGRGLLASASACPGLGASASSPESTSRRGSRRRARVRRRRRPARVRLGGPAPGELEEQARRAGGARSALPVRLPALRGTALRPGSGGPYASSADAERGRPREPRRTRRRHRGFVSRGGRVAASVSAADRRSVTWGRRRDGSENPRPLPARLPGKGPRRPVVYGFTQKGAPGRMNGDTRLLAQTLEFGGLGGKTCSVIKRLQVPVAFVRIVGSFSCVLTKCCYRST